MLRRGSSPEAVVQGGLLEGLRNSRAVMLGVGLASLAIFAGTHGAQEASALPTGVSYGDFPEQIDDFIEATPKPAPLMGQYVKVNNQLQFQEYPYDQVNLDRTNKDLVRFYTGCMTGPDGHIDTNSVKATRQFNSNIINASVVLADLCMDYTKWRVFATTEYKRGNMTKYVESKTTIPAYTNEDDIVNDAAYGKEYPMFFFPMDVSCQDDPTLKYRVKVDSVRYSRFVDKKFVRQTHSKAIGCATPTRKGSRGTTVARASMSTRAHQALKFNKDGYQELPHVKYVESLLDLENEQLADFAASSDQLPVRQHLTGAHNYLRRSYTVGKRSYPMSGTSTAESFRIDDNTVAIRPSLDQKFITYTDREVFITTQSRESASEPFVEDVTKPAYIDFYSAINYDDPMQATFTEAADKSCSTNPKHQVRFVMGAVNASNTRPLRYSVRNDQPLETISCETTTK